MTHYKTKECKECGDYELVGDKTGQCLSCLDWKYGELNK